MKFRKKELILDNFLYKYKTEGRSPKDFRNYQNPIKLFKDLTDGNMNPKEVLKNQINFKSDLGEIKKRKTKFKIKISNKCDKKCGELFRFKRKNCFFLEIFFFFLLSEAKYNAKYNSNY